MPSRYLKVLAQAGQFLAVWHCPACCTLPPACKMTVVLSDLCDSPMGQAGACNLHHGTLGHLLKAPSPWLMLAHCGNLAKLKAEESKPLRNRNSS